MMFENSLPFAQGLDRKDPLAEYRDQFHFPKVQGKRAIYFAGNSLGLQPKQTAAYVNDVMDDWANLAVEGHFKAEKPWVTYHERLAEPLSAIVGAKPAEVTVMNTLTVNLHLLFVSFYQPEGKRFKIICEEKAFPSDQYLLQSQVRFHGYSPEEAIVTIKKRAGEHTFRTEDILAKIREVGDACALVFLGGVNYYSGQVFDMQSITRVGHEVGAIVGWDLAHAAGNVALALHDWDVDFAAWCSYKYMNSGPGNASGCFIHERFHGDDTLPRFEGWWGTKKENRFLMKPEFEAIPTAEAWQLSNPPIVSLAPYLASLQQFEAVGMDALIAKRKQIVAYLDFILDAVAKRTGSTFEMITPTDPQARGTQISVLLKGKGKSLFDYLMEHGVILDWREPNVIRLAPAPLYCSYEDVYRFGTILEQGILKNSES